MIKYKKQHYHQKIISDIFLQRDHTTCKTHSVFYLLLFFKSLHLSVDDDTRSKLCFSRHTQAKTVSDDDDDRLVKA